MTDIRQLLEVAKHAAIEAGKVIMEIFHAANFSLSIKSNDTPITNADTSAHKIVTQHLVQTTLPILSEEGINISYDERKSWEYFWLTDPLDGTKEFTHKIKEFTVNIALMYRNIPVGGVIYAPADDALYWGSKETGVFKYENKKLVRFVPLQARKGFDELKQSEHVRAVASRSHLNPETKNFLAGFTNISLISMGSALKFMLLLDNRADVYPRLAPTMEWDTAAAHAILNASNRGVYSMDLKSELLYNKADLRNPSFIAF